MQMPKYLYYGILYFIPCQTFDMIQARHFSQEQPI